MRPMRRWLWCVLACVACSPAFAAPDEHLPEPLASELKRLGFRESGVSVYVHRIGEPQPLIAYAADTPRSPASTVKVLTTLAALEQLGPAHQWKTEVWADAPVEEGRLQGDLYIKGYGDPYLVIEHFWRLLRRVRQAGVNTIAGDLVIDRGYFEPEPEDAAEFDGQPERVYNVPPTALLVNFQAVNFRFIPDPDAKRVRIVADPWPAQFTLENKLRLGRGACRGGWASQLRMGVGESRGRSTVTFSGTYDAACGEREMFRVVSDALPYVRGVFASLWQEMGGQFDGDIREAPVPPEARLLAEVSSPPLADIVRSVNKYSNNVMTRQLLLTLGAQRGSPPGTSLKGLNAVQAWLHQHGLDFPELVLENGTGLSREERISARHLGQVLLLGYASHVMPEYLSSFPVFGMDGTLRRRGASMPLEGRAHLKTGAINNVRAVAGYVLDQLNRRVVVVVLHNDRRADTAAAQTFQDAVLEWVYSRP